MNSDTIKKLVTAKVLHFFHVEELNMVSVELKQKPKKLSHPSHTTSPLSLI